MRLASGFHCVVCGSVAALLFGSSPIPDRDGAAPVHPGAKLAFARADAALAGADPQAPDPRAALDPRAASDPGIAPDAKAARSGEDRAARPAPPDLETKVAIAEPVALPDPPPAAPLAGDPLAAVPVAAAPIAADPLAKVAPVGPDGKSPPLGPPDECLLAQQCIDQYLFSVYARAPKVDTVKVDDRIKMTVKKKGKVRTITKTVTKLVDEDFAWKDPKAAEKAGMSVVEYVVGGMDRAFKMRLYSLLRALDDAGLAPGITSGFRDDYRQSIASGNKAAPDRSFHGGSLRGGYGHGLAADLVSVRGATRAERAVSTDALWKWIDDHGAAYGIGRPYLDHDPPHVGPIDGQEYVEKRALFAKRAGTSEQASRAGKAGL